MCVCVSKVTKLFYKLHVFVLLFKSSAQSWIEVIHSESLYHFLCCRENIQFLNSEVWHSLQFFLDVFLQVE